MLNNGHNHVNFFCCFVFFMKKMTKLNVDCLNIIFDELQRDVKSLYSCLLVNKEWCYVAVPILWKKYSWCVWDDENRSESKKKIFNTILSSLPSSSKQLL